MMRTRNIACNPYFLKNRSALSIELPTILCARGFPKVFERRKHSEAPRTVENHESKLPHIGPKTKALVMVTTFIGNGAMIAWATINPIEIPIAQGPYAN